MPVESAADRAALFSTEEFAVAAQYTPPGGAPMPCTIIYDRERDKRPDFELGTGSNSGMRAVIARQSAQILADQVPTVVINATIVPGTIVNNVFVPGPDTLRVAARPRLDETGEIWTVDLTTV